MLNVELDIRGKHVAIRGLDENSRPLPALGLNGAFLVMVR